MKVFLVLLLCCFKNHIGSHVTYDKFLYKSAVVCIQSDHGQLESQPRALTKHLYSLHTCIGQLWKQCLVISESSMSDGTSKTWFPCNKGVTVVPTLEHHYVVETFRSFHFYVMFLNFHLERARGCATQRVLVRSHVLGLNL